VTGDRIVASISIGRENARDEKITRENKKKKNNDRMLEIILTTVYYH